ncbi:hypothetical protein QYF61_020269 [Mycteria americana]|uniref:Ciliogenesis-associated TTC17-interacting protein n=1 Tax=Mycteria americana TaxID=33587 RepID=A0AAN7MWU9_MYCAM|nr:hypothetical protein QYF61_020269 [Mycteria americana]
MDPPRECRQETPALTEAAAEFLSLIGPEELERCLFAETLEMVAAGGQPGDRARGQWWVTARWAPYEQAGEPVRSCVLVQAGSRGRQDGVPCSSTLKGEPGAARGAPRSPGLERPRPTGPGAGLGDAAAVPAGWAERGSALPAYVTPQLETLEQEEQERLEVTWVAVACPLAPVLPPCPGVCPAAMPTGGVRAVQGRYGQPGVPSLARTPVLSHQPGSPPLLWVAAGVGSFPQCIWPGTLIERGAGVCHLREGVPLLCPPPCAPHPSLQLRPHPIERRTHMLSHQHGMTVTKTLREGEAEQRCWSFSYGWAELRGLLLEGASLLLLRVLACRQAVPPGLIFLAIDTEGHLCTSSYRALGIQQQAVGLVEAEVFVIERAMLTGAGVSTIWQSSFLPSGRLAQRVQVGCPMLVVLQDESILTKTGGVEPQPSFPKEPLDWEEDIQLFSWFLDRKVRWGGHGDIGLCYSPAGSPLGYPGGTVGIRLASTPPLSSSSVEKDPGIPSPLPGTVAGRGTSAPVTTLPTMPQEELQASHAAYVQQHPELRALLADFLQALLLRQPHDPTSFAAQFFAPFACQRPPGTPFASAGAASPLPSTLPHHPPADGE